MLPESCISQSYSMARWSGCILAHCYHFNHCAHLAQFYADLCSGILYTKLQLVVRFRNDITVKLRVHIDDLTPVLVGARYSRRKSKVQILTLFLDWTIGGHWLGQDLTRQWSSHDQNPLSEPTGRALSRRFW